MMCKNFDENRKRCQQARCDKCPNLATMSSFSNQPLDIEGTGLGIDH